MEGTRGWGRLHKEVDKAAMKKDSSDGSAGPPSCWEGKCVREKINPGLGGGELLLSSRVLHLEIASNPIQFPSQFSHVLTSQIF